MSYTPPAGWQFANGVNEATAAFRTDIFYYPNNPGGIKTAAFGLTAGMQGMGQMTEWKNVSTVTPLDTSGVLSQGVNAASVTVSTVGNTAFANELTLTAVGWSRVGTIYTKGAGWTSLFSDVPLGSASDYRVNLPSGAQAKEIVTSNAGEKWSVVIAAFK